MTLERLACIRALINHPKISLLTLNAPHNSMNGVVPLGMAAWLNLPKVVKLVLEESADAISVDGMDCQGATPLMCEFMPLNARISDLAEPAPLRQTRLATGTWKSYSC
jgi:hypothetical protein